MDYNTHNKKTPRSVGFPRSALPLAIARIRLLRVLAFLMRNKNTCQPHLEMLIFGAFGMYAERKHRQEGGKTLCTIVPIPVITFILCLTPRR